MVNKHPGPDPINEALSKKSYNLGHFQNQPVGSLKNKFAYQLLLSATQVLVPLISYPYITRVIGPENLGKVNYVDFLSQLLIVFAGFGIPYYAVREIAVRRNEPADKSKFIREILVLHGTFAMAASMVFLLLTYPQFKQQASLYLLALLNILLSTCSFEWYMQGTESFRYTAIRTVVLRVLMLLAFFIFIQRPGDYLLYYGIFTAGNVLLVLFNSYKVFTENNFGNAPLDLRQHLRPLWHFFLTSSAISIYIYFDTILLQHLTHNSLIVGYYTAAVKLVKVCLVVLLVAGTVLMPRVSYLAGAGETRSVKNHLDKSLLLVLTAGIPIGAGLYLLAPEIVLVVAGEHFVDAIPLVRILSFLPLVIGLSNIFCFQTLVPFNKEKIFLAAAIAGCIASISLNYILIPLLSAEGAAWSNLVTELLITIITGWFAYRTVRFSFSAPSLLKTIVASAFFLPLIFLCRNAFHQPLFVLLSAMGSCILLYVFLQWIIFRNPVVIEALNYLSGFFTSKK